MSLILAIYLLGNKARVKRQCAALLTAFAPKRVSDACMRVGQMFIGTFSIFLSRQCLEACILGSILFVGMLIFGLPYAISLSCLTAVLALIPFIGAYMSFFIGFTMIVMMDPTKAVIFAIWFLLAQQVEGNVIYPHIVGSSVGLAGIRDAGRRIPGGRGGRHTGYGADYPGDIGDLSAAQGSRGAPHGGSRRGENASGILSRMREAWAQKRTVAHHGETAGDYSRL